MNYIRISASYLFNIELNGQFLLVKSERRNQYQPIGGCYKYYPEAEDFLYSIGAIPEKKSNGVDSLMDLRLMVPEKNIQSFINWFLSGEDRETTYDRELKEELLSLLPRERQLTFSSVMTEKQTDGRFDVYFDKERGLDTIKPMDIISINLTEEQKQTIIDFCQTDQHSLIFATAEDILNGYKLCDNNEVVKIGEHTKNILIDRQNELLL